MKIKTVTVIGSTGTMGRNVAGIFASFGNARVYCVARDREKAKSTTQKSIDSVRATAIAKNLIPTDYSKLEECIEESDLVFESLAEDMGLKTAIAKRVGTSLRPEAISCTGTSGLSISSLAECYPEEKRGAFFGVHLFNPPYNMSLCEFIPTQYTNKRIASEFKEYLSNTLYRTVVEVKDSPAFLANRIGFQFINEAMQYAEKYKDNGGIDYIDSILGSFTGRNMSPLMTSDFVGLDVHKAIVNNIFNNTHDYNHDTFVLPYYTEKLIQEKRLGRKTGAGLYQTVKYENGLKRQTVYDISTGQYRDVIPYVFPFAEKMKQSLSEGDYIKAFEVLVTNHSQEAEICLDFLLKYIVYSLYTSEIIGDTVEAADDVMASGFNWCPPLAMIDALSAVTSIPDIISERLPSLGRTIDVNHLLKKVKTSKYDYRPFFKSGR